MAWSVSTLSVRECLALVTVVESPIKKEMYQKQNGSWDGLRNRRSGRNIHLRMNSGLKVQSSLSVLLKMIRGVMAGSLIVL
mmetsp:Transcript_19751/g.22792  ORF Transcript_19751/g.22792 Transcript_19751/m.22792 type:complete len:81 (+) Transcript_19751:65-307(+)